MPRAVTDIGATTSIYDAEDRICAVESTPVPGITTMTGYLYNAEGVRVAKGPITFMSCDPALSGLQTATETDYVLGPGGEQLTEVGSDGEGNTIWTHTNIWGPAGLMATYDPDNLHFYLNDWLGSRRVQTGFDGVVERDCTSLPYGDGVTCLPNPPTEHFFTGKERDTESGNDYFGARYYASSMGRFSSPDPSGLFYADPTNPQSFNLYSYAQNNPLKNTDPDGLRCVWDDGSFDAEDDPKTGNQGGCEGQAGGGRPQAHMHQGWTGPTRTMTELYLSMEWMVLLNPFLLPQQQQELSPTHRCGCRDICRM